MSANMMALLMPSGWSDHFPHWACKLGSRRAVSSSLGVSSRMLFLTPRQWPKAARLPWNQQKTNPPPAVLADTRTCRLFQTSSCWRYQADRRTVLGAQGSPWILEWISTSSDTSPALYGGRFQIHALLLRSEPTDCRAVRTQISRLF